MNADFFNFDIRNAALVVLFLLTVCSGYVAPIMESPALRVARRWVRAAFFSLALATALDAFFPGRNFALLCACGVLLFFLAETLLFWVKIYAANIVCPIFGRYIPSDSEWSAEAKDVKMKLAIEALGFRKSGSMKSRIFEDIEVRMTCFDSPDTLVRLCVSFLPESDISGFSSSAVSVSKSGTLYITDYSQTPFGLAVPPNWRQARRPFLKNPLKILRLHSKRLAEARGRGEEFVPIRDAPVDFVNARVSELERDNGKAGLLVPSEYVDIDGVLNQEGRFRMWLDAIRLYYFPFFIK